MATKKKPVPKKHRKRRHNLNAAKPILTIYIQSDGKPFPPFSFVDGNGQKHPAQVYWQAVDPTTIYEIDMTQSPCPFKRVPRTFRTDANGTTGTLTVDKNCDDPVYTYTVRPVSLAFRVKGLSTPIGLMTSGGGIIIDS